MEQQVYRIPQSNYKHFVGKMLEMNRRIIRKKFHVAPYELQIVGYDEDERENGIIIPLVLVTVSGESPKYDGWSMGAVLDHLETGNIIRQVPGVLDDVEIAPYRHVAANCDECHTKQPRNHTYLLKHEDGRIVQLGSTCIKDFLGHNSPEHLAAVAEWLADLDAALRECQDERATSGKYLSLTNYLMWVRKEIRECGYMSKKVARERDTISTSAAAWNMMIAQMDGSHKYEKPTDEDLEYVEKALAWIRGLDEPSDENNYMFTLWTLCHRKVIEYGHIGYVASLLATYSREVQQQYEKSIRRESQQVGEVGQKMILTLTCYHVSYIDGFRGGKTSVYQLHDELENKFTWFATNDCLQPGSTYKLQVTIKGHDEYKGVKKTVITRCKILEELCKTA